MHAAEHDELGVGLGGEARQLFERIAGEVGVLVNIRALVVVAQQHGLVAEAGAGGADALVGVGVGQGVEAVKLMGTACIGCPVNQPWVQGRLAWRQPPTLLRCPLASLSPSEAFEDVVGIGEARRDREICSRVGAGAAAAQEHHQRLAIDLALGWARKCGFGSLPG